LVTAEEIKKYLLTCIYIGKPKKWENCKNINGNSLAKNGPILTIQTSINI
jgi:hypothetical protein